MAIPNQGHLIDDNSILAVSTAASGTLPDGSSALAGVASDAVFIGPTANAGLTITAIAKTEITIATAKLLSFEVLCGTTASNCAIPVAGHVLPFNINAVDDEVVIAAGDTLFEYTIPPTLFGANTYVQLKSWADEDQSGSSYDAFISMTV
ncbi:MAG: hypothetical protein DRQ46_00455 [Gammaproteobacteria bacterium]|nr:MAG: hypothetical protein DRQ46_00455 [Gammaproteobacteria bacterium]